MTDLGPGVRRRWLVRGAAFFLVLAVGFAGLRIWAQGREAADLFEPSGPVKDDPGRHGLSWKKIAYDTADRRTGKGWFLPGAGYYTVLWLHGNAVNMGDVLDRVTPLVKRFGASVLLIDYRGFGENPGTPDEEGLYLDAQGALEWLRDVQGVQPGRLVIYGHSLGGGVAVEMAKRWKPATLVLEATFTSVPDMARLSYPWLPVGLLVSSRFDNLAKIPALGSRLLVIHGEADPKIPVEMGKRLFAAAPGPGRELLLVPGAVHSDCYLAGGEAYWQAWGRALKPPAN